MELHTVRMEALVSDLSHALEETSCSSANRRRWGLCRRARSTGNLPLAFHTTQSDDSDSISEALLNRERGHSSLHQSDSDDVSPARLIAPYSLQGRSAVPPLHALESDSVNENFSPVRPGTRRRRKLKRMAVDACEEAAVSSRPRPRPREAPHVPSLHATARVHAHAVPLHVSRPGPIGPQLSAGAMLKKKRVLRHSTNCEISVGSVLCGKRKRSLRDRSGGMGVGAGDCDVPMLEDGQGTRAHKGSRGEDCMELSGAELTSSSPSLSSNESDAGFFTTDEGREGDDEHSDWCGGGGGLWEDDEDGSRSSSHATQGSSQDSLQQGAAFQAYLHMSADARRTLRESMRGREIRAGRRRLQGNRAAFTVLTSANEKLSRFLQDATQSELRLHPMQHEERDQLVQLANLYSLQMRLEPALRNGLTCPILTKTRDTVRVEQVTAFSRRLYSDLGLKRRKLPSNAGVPHQSAGDPLGPASESLTRSMGFGPVPVPSSYRTHSTGCQSN